MAIARPVFLAERAPRQEPTAARSRHLADDKLNEGMSDLGDFATSSPWTPPPVFRGGGPGRAGADYAAGERELSDRRRLAADTAGAGERRTPDAACRRRDGETWRPWVPDVARVRQEYRPRDRHQMTQPRRRRSTWTRTLIRTCLSPPMP